MAHYRITQIEDYEQFVGREKVQRIREKASKLKGLRVANFNSTYYGGGVAEMLSSLTLLMNSLGLRTEWRVIEGTPDFFSITKKMHNALQGGRIDLSSIKKEIFEQVIYENSVRNFLDHDLVIVHDPQPVPMIEHYDKKCPWVWRCHLDLSRPNAEMWKYLRGWIDNYDAVIVSCPEYKQEMKPPQRILMPAIDPFTIKNRQLSDKGNRRTARALRDTDRLAVGRANFAVRSVEGSGGGSGGVQAGAKTSRCQAGIGWQLRNGRP
jgi:trehalose synthase